MSIVDPLNNANNYNAQPLINGISFETLNSYEYRSLNFNETRRVMCSYTVKRGKSERISYFLDKLRSILNP